jgi:hypothetical protein
MAVLDLPAIKATLSIDDEITAFDALLETYLVDGTALVEAYIRTAGFPPIERRVVQVRVVPRPAVDAATLALTANAVLAVPMAPIDAATVSVFDPDGAEVDAADYVVDAAVGTITSVTEDGFAPGVHTVTVEAGLELDDDYEFRDLPVLRAAVRDYVVWLFEQRNPAAEYEAAGGGVATTFNKSADAGLPARIRTALDHWRASRAVGPRRRPIPSRV